MRIKFSCISDRLVQVPLYYRFAFLIFKSDLAAAGVDEFNVFQREKACYQKVLPRVYALLRCAGDDTCKLSPECLKIDENARPWYFAFEDLKHLGYANVDRRLGLDVSHLRLAVKKLAKWHAATAHLALVDPTTMEDHQFRNVSTEVTSYHAFFEGALRSSAEVVKTWSGCEKYGEKLYQLADTIIAKCCDVFTRDDRAFNVLTHGDLWIANVMFKNDAEGKPTDAVFVDYAVGFHGSPGIDLSYLLFTSNTDTNNDADWEELLRVYHTELAANLKKLGYTAKIPTLLEIYVEFLRKSYYALMISTFLIPLRLIEDTTNSDLSNLLGDQPHNVAFRNMLFGTPQYRHFLEPLLHMWYRKGLLEA